MFAPKDIVQNLLMSSARVRRFAQRRHDTGILGDRMHGRRVLSTLTPRASS